LKIQITFGGKKTKEVVLEVENVGEIVFFIDREIEKVVGD
jgi:hypothetical protein